eukprot:gb/GEZN01003551.1/.p1 GENE.gb/GEZN01003551.1/~~gb/GEZN01003551.1/.p1  ORF type:complete len:506 (+),score=46.41 gb/GEZN01003551.1/:79-1596(+)
MSSHAGDGVQFDESRYFPNTLRPEVDSKSAAHVYKKATEELASMIYAASPPELARHNEFYSTGGGLAYTFWRLYRQSAMTNEQFGQLAADYQKSNEVSISKFGRERFANCPTFLCGAAGVWAVGAVLRRTMKGEDEEDNRQISNCIDKLLALAPNPQDDGVPDELLYGRTGFLYCLLFVCHHLGIPLTPPQRGESKDGEPETSHGRALRTAIDGCFTTIIKRGREYSKRHGWDRQGAPLMYAWHEETYLGGAHGLSGIIYVLLDVTHMWQQDPSISKDIFASIDYLLTKRLPSGNYVADAMEDHTQSNPRDDRLVHWCHGAPAIAMLLAKAAQLTQGPSTQQRSRFKAAAVEAGEVVWTRGLLRKGVGLCHGVSGNAYVFWKLAELTGNALWMDRVKCFAQFSLHHGPPRLKALTEPDSSEHKKKTGKGSTTLSSLWATTDEPWSLMNGAGGAVLFYYDLAQLDSSLPHAPEAARSSSTTKAEKRQKTELPAGGKGGFPCFDLFV